MHIGQISVSFSVYDLFLCVCNLDFTLNFSIVQLIADEPTEQNNKPTLTGVKKRKEDSRVM